MSRRHRERGWPPPPEPLPVPTVDNHTHLESVLEVAEPFPPPAVPREPGEERPGVAGASGEGVPGERFRPA